MAVPPDPLAARFGEIGDPCLQSVRANDEESRTLAAIRDALLPKLLSGELRVGGMEAMDRS